MQEMSHFVSNLDQFVVDRLLYGAWMQLEQVCTGKSVSSLSVSSLSVSRLSVSRLSVSRCARA